MNDVNLCMYDCFYMCLCVYVSGQVCRNVFMCVGMYLRIWVYICERVCLHVLEFVVKVCFLFLLGGR